MMQIICFLALFSTVMCEKYYSRDFENQNTDYFAMESVMQSYIGCFLDRGPCGDLQARIKAVIPESTMNACEKCTTKQKMIIKAFFEALEEKFPGDYREYWKKYDSEGKYREAYLAAFADV